MGSILGVGCDSSRFGDRDVVDGLDGSNEGIEGSGEAGVSENGEAGRFIEPGRDLIATSDDERGRPCLTGILLSCRSGNDAGASAFVWRKEQFSPSIRRNAFLSASFSVRSSFNSSSVSASLIRSIATILFA